MFVLTGKSACTVTIDCTFRSVVDRVTVNRRVVYKSSVKRIIIRGRAVYTRKTVFTRQRELFARFIIIINHISVFTSIAFNWITDSLTSLCNSTNNVRRWEEKIY